MKKILSFLLIVVMVTASVSVGFAATKANPGTEIMPAYVTTTACQVAFSVSSTGKATMSGELPPRIIGITNKVIVDFTVKDSSNAIVHKESITGKWNDALDSFIASKQIQLPGKGAYRLYATFKCYRNGECIETIVADPILRSY